MEFPDDFRIHLKKAGDLRYGENPHQSAALYLDPSDMRPSVARARQTQGKELSFNNLQDADAAFECVSEFEEPSCVIVKHMNPCGVASAADIRDAYLKAFACDTVSAFGGIVAINTTLTAPLASELVKIFLEVVVAPAADAEALAILAAKPNVRVLLTGGMPASPDERASRGGPETGPRTSVRSIAGGLLVQSADDVIFDKKVEVVSKRAPTAEELADMLFAFTVVKHVKSNAIVYARDAATLGIGAGQMSRIDAAYIAARKALQVAGSGVMIYHNASLGGSVMASDAFMPFPDCVHAAHEAGATAIIQPGGSQKDQDSIQAADSYDMAMVFTGVRHFRH